MAIEFLTKNEKKQKAGAAVVELDTFESLEKAAEIDGREMGGMVIWATKDKGTTTSVTIRILTTASRRHSHPQLPEQYWPSAQSTTLQRQAPINGTSTATNISHCARFGHGEQGVETGGEY